MKIADTHHIIDAQAVTQHLALDDLISHLNNAPAMLHHAKILDAWLENLLVCQTALKDVPSTIIGSFPGHIRHMIKARDALNVLINEGGGHNSGYGLTRLAQTIEA